MLGARFAIPTQCIYSDEFKATDLIGAKTHENKAADGQHRQKIRHMSNLGNWSFSSMVVPHVRGATPALFDKGIESVHWKLIWIIPSCRGTADGGTRKNLPETESRGAFRSILTITIAHNDGSGIGM